MPRHSVPPDSALLIVLHGGPGSDYRYLLKCREFANQGFRVVFYDQRGSGLSQRFPKSSYSMQALYDELGGIIDHYRVSPSQKVFLLGQSWGAMLATAYVNDHPSAISGLILCEPGGLVWHDVAEYVERSREGEIRSELMNDITYMDQFITEKNHNRKFRIINMVYRLLPMAIRITLQGMRHGYPSGDGELCATRHYLI